MQRRQSYAENHLQEMHGDRTPKHAGMKLIQKPIKPRHNPLVHVHLGHRRYRSWKQFLDHAYWSVELK